MDTATTSVAQSFNWVNFLFLLFLAIERVIAWFLHYRSSNCKLQLCGSCLKATTELDQDPHIPSNNIKTEIENLVIHHAEEAVSDLVEESTDSEPVEKPPPPPPPPVPPVEPKKPGHHLHLLSPFRHHNK